MQDIEHYSPLFTYRHGILQTVPDSLSRMPGLREEGEPADTERFYTIQNFLAAEDGPEGPAEPHPLPNQTLGEFEKSTTTANYANMSKPPPC